MYHPSGSRIRALFMKWVAVEFVLTDQIPVFEAMIRGISVMRRSSDSWVNATQILKVAGIPKSARTKILDKEIIVGLHDKVQGGYGKYQGTW